MADVAMVLATYNEAANLPALVEQLEGLPPSDVPDIFVVDDSSPDGTADVVRDLAAKHGNISLVSRPGKGGLGSALRDGFKVCLGNDYTYIMTMDADLSHDPADVPRLLEAARLEDVDLVIGSRYISGGGTVGWTWRRKLQSRVANLMARCLMGTPNESTTNYRVYSVRAARLIVESSTARDFEFQLEAMLLAMSRGLTILQVPIIFAGRSYGDSKLSYSHTLKWGWFFLGGLVQYRLRKGKYSRPS